MNLRILNGEYFIVSTEHEIMNGVLLLYLPQRDAIAVNGNIQYINDLVAIMSSYLDLTDQQKKQAMKYAPDETTRSTFAALNRITRIRRRLYRSMKR